jgi:ketosteroid isomerase-like protein
VSSEESVRRFADAVTLGDADAAIAVCDPDIEFLSVLAVGGRAYKGHNGIREYFEDVSSAWSEWTVDVERILAAPDGRVAIVMTMSGRGRESAAGFSERTGHVWTLRNGKLLRNEPYRDAEGALAEVGGSP